MNKDLIIAVVRSAFRICCIYFLMCFLPPICIGPYINIGSTSNIDYNKQMQEQILKLKKLLNNTSVDDLNDDINDSNHDVLNSSESSESNDHSCVETETSDKNISNKNVYNNDTLNNDAYKEVKKNIINQLKEQYGDNIRVDFTKNKSDVSSISQNKALYAIVIKELGKTNPNPKDFDESEIYVNTKTKTFHVKTKNTFAVYPFNKKSVVRCDKNN